MITTDPTPIRTERTLTFFTWFGFTATALGWAIITVGFVFIWSLSEGAPFWPAYPSGALGMLVLMHAFTTLAIHGRDPHAPGATRLNTLTKGRLGLELHASAAFCISAYLWLIWAITHHRIENETVPWAIWPTLGLTLSVLLDGAVAWFRAKEAQQSGRISQLTQTRMGVVESQERELRRIERDLHDGAQARIVALNMQLGLVEQQLDKSPEKAREILGEARDSTLSALREMRDLARGIYPPVLADRGLAAAIASLAASLPLEVNIDAHVAERPPAALEGALYFVVMEAITNAVKHSGCTRVDVAIRRGAFDAVLTVTDNGHGGADTNGFGLTGIRRRIEAFDGKLTVDSPQGGPTVVRAEVPCAS
jgi:signal transduction histidine kinase